MEGIYQKIKQDYNSKFEFAEAYYTIITKLNRIKLTKTEMNLLCHCAVHGSISTPPVRKSFCDTYKVHKNTIYNIVSKMQKLELLVKINRKIRVNPAIQIDFSKPFYRLEIIMLNDGSSEEYNRLNKQETISQA